MYNKFPKRSGIYRVRDNIERLQLRLHFRHINSLLKLPKFDLNRNAAADWAQLRTSPSNNSNKADFDDDEVHTETIGWQQKILSSGEMELYREAANCRTDAHRRYHEWLLGGGGAHVGHQEPTPTSGHGARTRSKKRGRKSRHADETGQAGTKQPQIIFTYVHEDQHTPAGEEAADGGRRRPQGGRHLPPAPSAVMYVYAALQTDVLLIALRWHADDRLLHIYPDFSSFRDQPYFIEIDADYRHLYAYGFENVSPARPGPGSAPQAPAADFLQLPCALPPHWQTEAQRADEFAMPPKRCRRVALLLEIREARDFEYDRLHVRYRVRLPVQAILEEGQLEASTHTSASSGRRHRFGHVCQLTLLCEEDYARPLPSLCHVFFEVISIDGWQRERVEGFAHCAVPLQPADSAAAAVATSAAAATYAETQHLRCLRPVESFLDSLNRYFIGGRQRFDVERFFLPNVEGREEDEPEPEPEPEQENSKENDKEKRKNSDDNDEEPASESPSSDADEVEAEEAEVADAVIAARGLHSRHGCRMQSTGVLTVACRRLTQRNCALLETCVNQGGGMTLDDIMLAYREARRRLEEVVLK